MPVEKLLTLYADDPGPPAASQGLAGPGGAL